MNYKSSNKIAAHCIVLSYFHRGLFWGTIFAWIAVISGACGATITKAFYLDRREIIIDRGYAVFDQSQSLNSLGSYVMTTTESLIIPVSVNNSELQSSEFSFVGANHFLLSPNYGLANQISLKDIISPIPFFSVIDNSIIKAFNSLALTYLTPNFKDFKITIQNTTNDSTLGKQVYSYLQKRDFTNIAIAEPQLLNLSQTTITTQAKNLPAANYLKSTLSFGILNLIDYQSFDGYSDSELIIRLGEDAKSLATNQNFIDRQQ